MKTVEEKLEIYRAYLNGETIQWRPVGRVEYWEDMDNPSFDYRFSDYRVKPEQQNKSKKKVAYAFLADLDGYIFWTVDPEKHINRNGYCRRPEFDIIANEPD